MAAAAQPAIEWCSVRLCKNPAELGNLCTHHHDESDEQLARALHVWCRRWGVNGLYGMPDTDTLVANLMKKFPDLIK